MTFPMYGTQYPQQQQYYYPGMGQQQQQYWPTQPAPATDNSGSDVNAILGSIIEPLMGLVFSMLTGTPETTQVCDVPADDSPVPDETTSASGPTLTESSDAKDYLEVLTDNDNELEELEAEYGDADGLLTQDEIEDVLDAIKDGDVDEDIEISEDLNLALNWLHESKDGKAAFNNLSGELNEDGDALVDINHFQKDHWEDIDGDIEDKNEPATALAAVKDLNEDLFNEIDTNKEDTGLTKAEIDKALKENEKLTFEERGTLRFLSQHYVEIGEVVTNTGREGTFTKELGLFKDFETASEQLNTYKTKLSEIG